MQKTQTKPKSVRNDATQQKPIQAKINFAPVLMERAKKFADAKGFNHANDVIRTALIEYLDKNHF